MTSNPEHDNSVVRMFTSVCGKGRESSSKNCQPDALYGDVATQQTYRRYFASCHADYI